MNNPHKSIALGRGVFQWVQIERSHSSQEIHIVCPLETASTRFVPFEYLPEDEEGDDDGSSKVCLEEGLGTAGGVAANRLLGGVY